jgi:hypothetical protein
MRHEGGGAGRVGPRLRGAHHQQAVPIRTPELDRRHLLALRAGRPQRYFRCSAAIGSTPGCVCAHGRAIGHRAHPRDQLVSRSREELG